MPKTISIIGNKKSLIFWI